MRHGRHHRRERRDRERPLRPGRAHPAGRDLAVCEAELRRSHDARPVVRRALHRGQLARRPAYRRRFVRCDGGRPAQPVRLHVEAEHDAAVSRPDARHRIERRTVDLTVTA
ncbi:hypothetical protein F01_450002 [Burkholderia cenocepacia]|nr:hypothetical protein F01_450002 [Burkholderia cenocepacia]